MSSFRVDTEDTELSVTRAAAIGEAMDGFVRANVPLSVELLFVDEAEIRRLNLETRGVDKVTDVLSFPTLEDIKGEELFGENYPYDIDEDGVLTLGSIVVCKKRAREQAEEYGHSYERELHYLIVHGIMHCLGYDHETDEEKKEMREKEELILKKLGIAR